MQGLPDGARRVKQYAARGYPPEVMMSEDGVAFLDRVAGLDDPIMRAAVESLKAQFPAFAAERDRRDAALRAATAPASRPATDAAGPPEVVVRPLPAMFRPYSCIPAGEGIDILWAEHQSKLLLMSAKGQAQPVYDTKERNSGFDSACFDGRYVWAHVATWGRGEPVLAIVEPRTREVWTITAADGLPTSRPPPGANPLLYNRAVIAPLAPGKVCVAAALGHTWIAIVSFDPDHPEGPRTVNVFHEARVAQDREPREQWEDTHVAFDPTYAFTLNSPAGRPEPAAGATSRPGPSRRIIIGRAGANIGVSSHPLLIDPATLRVQAADCEVYGGAKQIINEGDALYWAWPGPDRRDAKDFSLTVWRFGFPDFVQTPVAQFVHEGNESAMRLASYDGRVLLATGIFWSADSFNGPFRPLRGSFMEGEDVRLPDRQFFRSNVYGLLLHTYRGLFQIEFPRATDAPATNHSPPDRPR